VRDRDLSNEVKQEREIRRREHEIEVVLASAVVRGTPLSTVMEPPAGLMGPGSAERLNPGDDKKERAYIVQRYNALKEQFNRGVLDHEAYGREKEEEYKIWAKGAGVLREVTDAELIAEHQAEEKRLVQQLNDRRAKLGLPLIELSEKLAKE